MNQLDQVTHENSQIANQSAVNAGNLAHQADSLLQASAQLREVIFGSGLNSHGKNEKPKDQESTSSKAAPSSAKVIAFRQEGAVNASSASHTANGGSHSHANQKMVVGGDRIPTEHDPRFVDL
jgi:hypothetical protein